MKTNYKIIKTLIFIFIIGQVAFISTSGQRGVEYVNDTYGYRSGDGLVINNYYGDGYLHDFYYTSRIKRFHGAFVSAGYYEPCFTNYYWYTYQPAYIGWNIYWGPFWNNFNWGISFSWPAYHYAWYRPRYSVYYPGYYRMNYYSGFYDGFYFGNYSYGYRYAPVYRATWTNYRAYNYGYVPGLGYHSYSRYDNRSNMNYYSNSRNSNSVTYVNAERSGNSNRNINVHGRGNGNNNNRVHINNITVNNNNTRGNSNHVNRGNNRNNKGNQMRPSAKRELVNKGRSDFNRGGNNPKQNINRYDRGNRKSLSVKGNYNSGYRKVNTSTVSVTNRTKLYSQNTVQRRSYGSKIKAPVTRHTTRSTSVSTSRRSVSSPKANYRQGNSTSGKSLKNSSVSRNSKNRTSKVTGYSNTIRRRK